MCLALPVHGAKKSLHHIFLPLNPADVGLDGWCRYIYSFLPAPSFHHLVLSRKHESLGTRLATSMRQPSFVTSTCGNVSVLAVGSYINIII